MFTDRPPSHPGSRLVALLAAAIGLAACARIAGLEDHHLEQPGSDASIDAAAEAGADAADGDSAVGDSADASEAAIDVADVTAEEPSEAGGDVAPEAQPDAATHKSKAVIAADADDAMWTGCTAGPTDERLYADPGDRSIMVSDDEDDECAGLRFTLDIPAGAKLASARLTLSRSSGDILEDHTLLVRAWNSSSVPPFDDSHSEVAAQHDPGGLLGVSVGGWKPGTVNGPVTTPDLAVLLQAVVDRSDWAIDDQHRTIGLLLVKEQMAAQWVGFGDSSGALAPASLEYEWTE